MKTYLLTDISTPKQWKTISISEFTKEGYPVFGANGIIGYYNKYNHENPTLLITCRGATCGELNISLPFSYINGNAMALDDLDVKTVDIKYLYYYLKKRGLNDVISGSAQPQITRIGLLKIQIPLPSIDEQRQIAIVLDKADTLRQKRKQSIQLLEDYLKSVFYDMFDDPVKNEKGWEIKLFGDIINSIRYGTGSPPEYSDIGIPFIRATNIKGGTIIEKEMKFISVEESEKINKCKIYKNNLIIVRSGVNSGDCAIINDKYNNAFAGYDLIIEIDYPYSVFYNYLLNSSFGKSILKPLTRRAGQPHLNSEQIQNLNLFYPPLNLQNKFARIVEQVEQTKSKMEQSLKEIDNLFNSLMNKFFGK